jgi:hypothetical protein
MGVDRPKVVVGGQGAQTAAQPEGTELDVSYVPDGRILISPVQHDMHDMNVIL